MRFIDKERLFGNFRNRRLTQNITQAIPFWIASIMSGLLSVCYTKLFNFSENLLVRYRHWNGLAIFILAPISFVIAWYIVKQFAPGARGSGIPQVMAAIDLPANKYDPIVSKLLGLRIIVFKILSSMLMVLGGGAIGREGPTIQISSSVFYLTHKLIPDTWSKLSAKSYYITGAAAGLAAAFNTPLGGIVFAIEELAKVHVSFFRTALFSAVIIAGLTAQAILGPYLYLGYPRVQNIGGGVFFVVILTAAVAGIAGSAMSSAILKIINWKKNFSTGKEVLWIIFIGLVVATISYNIDDNVLGSGKQLMNRVLFTPDKFVGPSTVLARIFGPVLSFNIGASGGIFAPSLAAGASLGAYISELLGVNSADCNVLILCGMVGFLTGVTRTPFTSAILVLEMTDRHSLIFHLMVAALVSNLFSLLVDRHSLYEHLKGNYINNS